MRRGSLFASAMLALLLSLRATIDSASAYAPPVANPPAAPAPPAKQPATASPAPPLSADGKLDGIASGKLGGKKTERGLKIVSNVPGVRYTFEVVGKEIKPQHEERLIWVIDGSLLQAMTLAMPAAADGSDAKKMLEGYRTYELEHWTQNVGWKESDKAPEWIAATTGEPILVWEIINPAPGEGKQGKATKNLFATTLIGRNVFVLTATIFPTIDEAKARQLMIDTMQSLVRYEPAPGKPTAPPVAANNPAAPPADNAGDAAIPPPGDANAMLISQELGSLEDKKSESANVVPSAMLAKILRVALEFDKQPQYSLTVTDGYGAHTVSLDGYDHANDRFVIWEPRGDGKSFLSEGSNRAGVKAQVFEKEKKRFSITEAELVKVTQGALFVPGQYVRLVALAGNYERAVPVYESLKKHYPNSDEVSADRLIKAGELFLKLNDLPRAQGAFVVCFSLYDKHPKSLAGIGEVFRRTGNFEPSANFFGDAITALDGDKTIGDAEKASLKKAWGDALAEVKAKAKGGNAAQPASGGTSAPPQAAPPQTAPPKTAPPRTAPVAPPATRPATRK